MLKQRWAELLFLHWPVDADSIRATLPPRLELDTFEGRAYVGVVPFTVREARTIWTPPLPLLSNFHEVNVRTYVRQGGGGPGVWFYSLDASNLLVAPAGRFLYKLPYHYAQIRFEVDEPSEVGAGGKRRWIRFTSRRVEGNPPDCDVRYGPAGAPEPAAPGTLEHFLVERYVMYAFHEGALYQARVHHVPYPQQPALVESLRESLVAAAGLTRPKGEPLAHYARELSVEIDALRRV